MSKQGERTFNAIGKPGDYAVLELAERPKKPAYANTSSTG